MRSLVLQNRQKRIQLSNLLPELSRGCHAIPLKEPNNYGNNSDCFNCYEGWNSECALLCFQTDTQVKIVHWPECVRIPISGAIEGALSRSWQWCQKLRHARIVRIMSKITCLIAYLRTHAPLCFFLSSHRISYKIYITLILDLYQLRHCDYHISAYNNW